MKRKTIIIFVALVITVSALLCCCNAEQHVCSHVCFVCGGCKDMNCNEQQCQVKCSCNQHHTCTSVCPLCNKCTNYNCTDAYCAQKCQCDNELIPPEFNDVVLYNYFTSELLPRIDVNTKDGIDLDDESLELGYNKGLGHDVMEYDYTTATISVSNCEGYNMSNVSAQVKIRGNYTSTYPKRPLRIKFDKKQNMCGLNDGLQFKNWVLLNEYKDNTLLRNSVAFNIGNSILESDGLYCTDFRPVELYINGKYNGMYLLAEQQEAKEGRVELDVTSDVENDDDNLHIGYLMEFDGYYKNENAMETFTLNYDVICTEEGDEYFPVQCGYTIKSDVDNKAQHDFVNKCMQTIWDVIYDAMYNDHSNLNENPFFTMDDDGNMVEDTSVTSIRQAVEKVVDITSLVDTYIINEICGDADISWSSFYLSLDMSSAGNHKLTFSAPWDFDCSLGDQVRSVDYEVLYAANSENPWLTICSQQGWFWTHVNAKWQHLQQAEVFANCVRMLCDYTTMYADEYNDNFDRWPECIGTILEGAQVDVIATHKTHQEASDYLKEWFENRVAFLEVLFQNKAESYQ